METPHSTLLFEKTCTNTQSFLKPSKQRDSIYYFLKKKGVVSKASACGDNKIIYVQGMIVPNNS